MQLRLKDVAKIKEATINVDGITVIAGENNTGKSKIGKVLFSIFNSMGNMEKKIGREKQNKLVDIITFQLQNGYMQGNVEGIEYRRNYRLWSRRLAKKLEEIIFDGNTSKIEEVVTRFIQESSLWKELEEPEEWIGECVLKLEAIINIPDKKVMMEVITRWFDKVFEGQLSPLAEENVISQILLGIKDKWITCSFEDNICMECNTELNIMHEAFYIDNPFVIDYMSKSYLRADLKATDAHLLRYLCKEDDIFDNIFDSIIAKEKLDEINGILSEIVGGEFVATPDGEYCLTSKKFNKPINVKNLSTGLKSFALIKRLLENGSLREKDVLILDEPEIHLHPEWQLAYAQIIVLLQKKFDLTTIITTHSPYFLDAIDIFSAKYGMSNRVNYYLAECEDEVSYLRDVTNNIDAIYKKLSDPLQKLENMRSGLL